MNVVTPRARFVPNDAGMEAVLRLPPVENTMHVRAEQIAGRARSAAPVGETGSYRASIRVELDDEASANRPRYRVIADDYKAAWIEWGTVKMPAQRVLGAAAG